MDEKPKRKVPAKRKKSTKASTSETDVELRSSKHEDQNIEVDLPPGTSLLQNKRLGVGIMCQLLSDDDSDTINEGRIQSHLDEFLWDGLKSNLRAMGLVYHTTDKVMVNRFDEAQAKIGALKEMVKQKDADNSVLIARIVDAYKKATLKARYDLLKEYKQGLLVDADVEEEIELYEESLAEVGDSSSTPVAVTAPTTNEPEPVAVEPLSNVDPSEGRETQ
ncbi:hypothetical protein TIFTF001_045151 [Ficus carica]|uniref:Uncharacterized protein n=1 Tax=Ficus carica TaxID=3494 RepID=A0AA88CIZ7_FICCA|nr:hypothetical protein TIFTF001_045151 [Ficus carica]